MAHEFLLGVAYAQGGYPLAERGAVGGLDVGGEVGAVGGQLYGQLLYGQPGAGVAVRGRPPGEPPLDVGVVGGQVGRVGLGLAWRFRAGRCLLFDKNT